MKMNSNKFMISITLLFLLAISLYSPIDLVTAEPDDTEEGSDKPSVFFTDYNNGTTRTIIDYHNGTIDTIVQTIQINYLEIQEEQNTEDIIMSVATPTLTKGSTEFVIEPTYLTVGQDVLMGFTVHQVYTQSGGGGWPVKTTYYAQGDLYIGLRYPVLITLEYPDVMTVEHDHELRLKVTPLDAPDFDEFLLYATVSGWTKVEVWAVFWWETISYDSYSDSYDYSLSFPTPVGPDMSFPLGSFEMTLFDGVNLTLNLIIWPQLGSDKITTQVSTSGDATGNQVVTMQAPEEWAPFTVHADDYGPTDYAYVTLSDYRYYFSLFNIQFKLHFDFHNWIENWLGDPTITFFTLDWSDITEDAYLPVHEGTDPTMSVSIFVQKFGLDLSVSPGTLDIEPGYWGTYTVTVMNTGNVLDSFDTFYVDQPPNWEYMFSPSLVSMNPGESKSLQVSIKPWRHYSTAPGDYTVTVWGRSEGAWLWDLVRTDSDDTVVHVLPFYEVDISIDPESQMVKPGETASYALDIQNLGNVIDSFDLTPEYFDFGGSYRAVPGSIQPGWVTIDPDIGPLDPGEIDSADLIILVPSDWAGMEDATYDFDVTATSLGDTTHIPPASDTDSAELVVEATKESMVRYIRLELEWLTEDVTSWPGDEDIKQGLLDKLTAAMEKYGQTLDNILEGREKQANNMLKAWKNIMSAFISLVEAQDGKNIGEATALDWIGQAETIISDIDTAIATPID